MRTVTFLGNRKKKGISSENGSQFDDRDNKENYPLKNGYLPL